MESRKKEGCRHECFIVAARPYLEKAVDDRFYLSEREALVECSKMNSSYGILTYKVFRAFIVVEKDAVYA